jgi:tetratricopeptide (TPR) repeat protein
VGKSSWVYSPVLDLLVGCGAWSIPLLLFAYRFGGAEATWVVAFYALALLVNYPHYMATIYRAYGARRDFSRYRVYTQYVTGILVAALLAAHWSYRLVPVLFTIYLTWSPWHYMGQNYGLLMMFARRNGVEVRRNDRNAIWAAFVASYLMIFLTFHANPSADPYALSLGLPSAVDLLRIPLLAVFAVLGIWPLSRLVRQAGWRAMVAPMTLYVTEFLWFVLPTIVELVADVRLPQASYSAGILAVMHSAQYIWITSYFARREAQASQTRWRPSAYFATLAIGGIALFVPGPWAASYLLGRDFTSSFLVFTALVNIHHFVLDGVVWKLRESRVAALLIPGSIQEDFADSRVLRTESAPGWRYARVGLVAVLLLLAGLDQMRHFYLVFPGAGTSNLVMAASLNPNDTSVQTLLGKSYAAQGNTTLMEQTLKKSLDINPHNTEALNTLVRAYIEAGRHREALKSYEDSFARVDPDAASLVNYGILSLERNDIPRAIRAFREAIDTNPGYAPAQLYLGDLIQSQGHIESTRAHYRKCEEAAGRAGNTELATACRTRASALER